MAFTYGFYNSLKGDRKYNAEQMSEIFDGILKDGIIPSIGQLFAVKTANNGMQITVGTGRAWFHHTWSKNDSVMVLTLPYSDISRNRYDAVVLEVNRNDDIRANSIKIVSGVADVNPAKPMLVNTDKVHQYPLAYILVEGGSDIVEAKNIENMVGRSPTVFATGVLETASLDALWSQWEGEWDEWFEDIKVQLSGNVATNLQLQIDQLRNKIPDKASNSETINGTNSIKYTTPAGVKAAINAYKDAVKDQNGTTLSIISADIIPKKAAIPASMAYINPTATYGRSSGLVRLSDYIVRYSIDEINVTFTILTSSYKWYGSYKWAHGVSLSSVPNYTDSLAINGTNYFFLAIEGNLFRCYATSSYVSVSSLGSTQGNGDGHFQYINPTYSIYYTFRVNSDNEDTGYVYKLNNSTNSAPIQYTWNVTASPAHFIYFGYGRGVMRAYWTYSGGSRIIHFERFDALTGSGSALSYTIDIGSATYIPFNKVYYDSERQLNVFRIGDIFYRLFDSGSMSTVSYEAYYITYNTGTLIGVDYKHGTFEYFIKQGSSLNSAVERISYLSNKTSVLHLTTVAESINPSGDGYVFVVDYHKQNTTYPYGRIEFYMPYDGRAIYYLAESMRAPGSSIIDDINTVAYIVYAPGFTSDILLASNGAYTSVYDTNAVSFYGAS